MSMIAFDINRTDSYSIVSLLPQSCSAIIRDNKMCNEILTILYRSIDLLIETLNKFYIEKRYKYFDPHIGESACQIRTCMFIFLASEIKDDNVVKRISFLMSKKSKIIDSIHEGIVFREKGKKQSIEKVMNKNDINFSLSVDEVFLFKSYFLTIYKEEINGNSYIDKIKISRNLNISNFLSKKISYKYQVFISRLSCDFVYKIAREIGYDDFNYENILNSAMTYEGKMAYPCFFYSKVIFEYMIKMKFDFLLKIEDKDVYIFFEEGDKLGKLIDKEFDIHKRTNACMMILCSSLIIPEFSPEQFLKRVNDFGLLSILLMNMAAHPQYIGVKAISLSEKLITREVPLSAAEERLVYEFERYKLQAKKFGFCRESSSFLLVKHIFIDSVSRQLEFHQKENNTFAKSKGYEKSLELVNG